MSTTNQRTEHSRLIALNDRIDEIFEQEFGKEAYQSYRKNWHEVKENLAHNPEFPIQLDFELNYSCNLRCPMCTWSAEVTKGKTEQLDFERFKEIIQDGVQRGLQAVRLNMINEPLLRKDLPKFIKFCREMGIIDVFFSTNGSLLRTEAQCRELISAGLTKIQFSIDAITEETYQKVRVGTSLKRVTNAIEMFLKVKREMNAELPLVRVNFVRQEKNYHELDDFVKFWQERAVDLIAIQDHMALDVKTQRNTHVKNFDNHQQRTLDPEFEHFKCALPFRMMGVHANGQVSPCCAFYGSELVYGDIGEDFATIWNSDKMNELRTLHREGRYKENDVCRRCVESHAYLD